MKPLPDEKLAAEPLGSLEPTANAGSKKRRILLVETDTKAAADFTRLSQRGSSAWEFIAAATGAQAIKLLERVLRDHPETEQAEAARKRLEELKKG